LDWKEEDTFSQEIIELYKKYNDNNKNYSFSDEECKLIRSPEYAFYQGYRNLPEGRDGIASQKRVEQGWFKKLGSINTGVADWLCELTQNAFDRGAKKCTIIIENDDRILKFGHNGRGIEGPDTSKNDTIGDVHALIKMGLSLKSFDLYSEGRFGMGFKYWKRHFSEVILNSDGFSFGWTRDNILKNMENRDMSSFSEWTLFQFQGAPLKGAKGPLNLKIDDLRRLRDAIRMRSTDFVLDIIINNSKNKERITWKHKITDEKKFEEQTILSCIDSEIDSETREVVNSKSTLMLIPQDSKFFPQTLVSDITKVSIKTIEGITTLRKELGEENQLKDPLEIVKEWFSRVPFVLGFFHEQEDYGSLLSMFPLTNEGRTDSRISFSAPFRIKPSRLDLLPEDRSEGLQRNRILIQMMLHSFGQFLKCVQQEEDILSPELIQHLLDKPPGQSNSSNLDNLIRRYSKQKRIVNPISRYVPQELMSPSEVFNSECWPTLSGLHSIGNEAKQLDILLIKYRKHLLENKNIDDIEWLAGLLEDETIVFGEDDYDYPIPICNWITEFLSKGEVGYSGLNFNGGNNNAS